MKIAHMIAPALTGGLENVVKALATAQIARGHQVHVAATLDPDGPVPPFLDGLEQEGVAVEKVVVGRRAYATERRMLVDLCTRAGVQVLHTHGYRSDVVGLTVARAIGIPILSTVHGFTGGGLKNRFYELVQRLTLGRLDAVVCVSRPQLETLRRSGVSASKLALIPNARPETSQPLNRDAARESLGLPQRARIIGWVGRLSKEKGPDLFLEALARLRDPSVHASIIGDGVESERLQRRARSLQLEGRLAWHGQVDDAARFLRAFDVFVLSSRSEGTPMVLLEAMEAGVPIVATSVGGVSDLLSAEEALLVEPEDEAISRAIRATLDDTSAAQRRVDAATRKLENEYAQQPWVERYEGLYQRLLVT